MKTIQIKCEMCNKEFKKPLREHRRSIKLKRKEFCSRSCAGKSLANVEHLLKVRTSKYSVPGNKRDDYTLFRRHLRRSRMRVKENSLTLEDLKEVWEKQNGVCVYSKVKLIEASNSKRNNPIYAMSLDRIDSSVGYHKDNIQFISIAMNHLKNKMTHQEMLEMLEIIKRN